MRKTLCTLLALMAVTCSFSQDLHQRDIPLVVKNSLNKKFPAAKKVSWEKENGNYEANWGGRSGEDHSAQFSPDGRFVEIVDHIRIASLPAPVPGYVMDRYKDRIREAGRLTDARGNQFYEVEIKDRDLLFGLDGKFLRESH